MQYRQAKNIALRILKQLDPFCKTIDIAGSIRREKPEVKDIEICCVPRITEIKDLFGEVIATQRLPQFVQTVQMLGKTLKGSIHEGRYVQIALCDGVSLDLFMPVENDYYRQYSIRTGSADYSHKVLATAWLRTGWCGTENGLRLQIESYQKPVGKDKNGNEKKIWICERKNPTLPPVFDSEYSFFKFIGLTWVEPKYRTA